MEELCKVIGVTVQGEREEFSLYCIIEGQTFTRPLYKEQYILDVTTDLQRQGAIYYLIFCRSVWHYPLRLDNKLYIEVVFNQIAPDYLEGLLLVMPSEQIDQDIVYQVAKVAALLHKAADMDHVPTLKETKFLLPKPALSARDIKPPQWVNMVQVRLREENSRTELTLLITGQLGRGPGPNCFPRQGRGAQDSLSVATLRLQLLCSKLTHLGRSFVLSNLSLSSGPQRQRPHGGQ